MRTFRVAAMASLCAWLLPGICTSGAPFYMEDEVATMEAATAAGAMQPGVDCGRCKEFIQLEAGNLPKGAVRVGRDRKIIYCAPCNACGTRLTRANIAMSCVEPIHPEDRVTF